MGQAAGRAALTPELVGINWKDASLPDNAGVLCQGEPIDPDGADAHFSTLPVKEMVSAIRGAGVPAQLSLSAGGYLCNCLLYHLAGLAKERGIPGGFLHVPCCCEQVLDKPSCPSLPLPAITAGLEAAPGGHCGEPAERMRRMRTQFRRLAAGSWRPGADPGPLRLRSAGKPLPQRRRTL